MLQTSAGLSRPLASGGTRGEAPGVFEPVTTTLLRLVAVDFLRSDQRRRKVPALLVPACLILTCLLPAVCSGEELRWEIETVDPTGGRSPSLALDSRGNPHISSNSGGSNDLRYAYNNGHTWDNQTVDSAGQTGGTPSLALGADDRPRIVYLDWTEEWLKHASYNGSTWSIQNVDSLALMALSSLAVDADGVSHICYGDYDLSQVKYATWNGSNWDIQVVDQARGSRPVSLALDASGWPHIAYTGLDGSAKYAAFNGSTWDTQTVESGFSGQMHSILSEPSLALDDSGNPHMSYWYPQRGLKYAAFDGHTWDVQLVDGGAWMGQSTSLALDGNGHPRISYRDGANNNDLRYATSSDSGWEIHVVDSESNVGGATSLALDPFGRPHISYSGNNTLRYAVLVPEPSCTVLLAVCAVTAAVTLALRRRATGNSK